MRTEVSLPVSAFSSIDCVARLRASIYARVNGLTFQFINVLGRPEGFLSAFEDEVLVLQSLINRLDNNSVICNGYHAVARDWKVFPKDLESHSIRLFGSFTKKKFDSGLRLRIARGLVANGSPDRLNEFRLRVENEQFLSFMSDRMIQNFKEISIHGRKAELMRRLFLEVEERFNQGWFFVFNTLTVDPEYISRVFPENNRIKGDLRASKFLGKVNVWTNYVREIDRYFAAAAFGSVRRGHGLDYHSYFAVVERGSRGGALHIHVIHMFKSLPSDFSDPNLGSTVPYNREVVRLKGFWKYGFSSPIAVRFSGMDSYARVGWRWPVKRIDGSNQFCALDSKGFAAIINYVGKYLTKSYNHERKDGCIWRTRISRNLGKRSLNQVINRMPLKCRLTLLQQLQLPIKLGRTRTPRFLLRRLLLKSLPRNVFYLLYRRALKRPIQNLLRLYLDSVRKISGFNLPNFGSTPIRSSRIVAVFSFFKEGSFVQCLAGSSYA